MSDSTVPTEPVSPAAPATEPAAPAATEPAAPAAPAATDPSTDPAPTVDPAPAVDPDPVDDDRVQTFDRAYVEQLRAENARHRTAATEARAAAEQAAADAAKAARDEFTQSIGRAIGLVPDETVELTPEQLLEQANAQRTQAEQTAAENARAARAARVDLALHVAAGNAGADTGELLDSVSFRTAIDGLDPSAADFTTQVEAAVAAAVETNPRFRKATEPALPARSGGDPNAGDGDRSPAGDDTSIAALLAKKRQSKGRRK